MAKIKKAQLGSLIKKGVKAVAEAAPKKVVIPPKLKLSIKKSQSPPTKLKNVGASEAEKIAHGKKTHMQEQPYDNPDYDKPTFLEREVKKTKPKRTTDKYGFDLRPDRNGGMHKAQTGTTLEQKQFNSPSAVKMRKTISKQKAGLKKRAWSDSSLEPQKKKMKNGGSLSGLKASNKRVGPVDPKGAFTAVQKKTLAGAKGKASLTKDKQLGATKMTAKAGKKISKK